MTAYIREFAMSEDPSGEDFMNSFRVMRTLMYKLRDGGELPCRQLEIYRVDVQEDTSYLCFISKDQPELNMVYQRDEMAFDGTPDYCLASKWMRDVCGDGATWRFRIPGDQWDPYMICLRYYSTTNPELANISLLEEGRPND